MSWTIPGARHIGKAIQLASNGGLNAWCDYRPLMALDREEKNDRLTFDIFDDTFQSSYISIASITVFKSPHDSSFGLNY